MAQKVTVRYGSMGMVGTFSTEMPDLRRGDRIVVKTERGTEAGDIVHTAAEVGDSQAPSEGEVVRYLTAQDEDEIRRVIETAVPKELTFCRDRIRALDLPMKLVDAEHLLGGEKIIFYFLADGRVDFRQLVKDIAREYKTRIELRQIGVRDEARLLAELGHCGQCLCCRSFMKSLEPVTMRMAKSQKATLDPTKISGVCGRLMCCLRYEDKVYSDLKTKLPKRGLNIVTKKGSGKIVDADVLAQMLTIKTTSSTILRVHVSEILSIEGSGAQPSGGRADDDAAGPADEGRPCQAHGAGEGGCPNCPQQAQGDKDGPSQPQPQGQQQSPGQQGRREGRPGGRERQQNNRDRQQGPRQGQGPSHSQGQNPNRGPGQGQGQRRPQRRNRPGRQGGGNGGNAGGGNGGGGNGGGSGGK